jgi:hypothetical protein
VEDDPAANPATVDPVVRPAKLTAIFTGFIAFFTLAYTIIMGFYTHATYSLLAEQQKSSEFSKEVFYIQQRPWLTIANFGQQPFIPNDSQETIPISYMILNSGYSIARDISISTETFIDNSSQGSEEPLLVKIISPQRLFQR